MKLRPLRALLLAATLAMPLTTQAQDAMINLPLSDPARWDYFSDRVMGGVSQGRASFENRNGTPILRLTGQVSTANRGGFIQARQTLDSPPPEDATGVILSVRGTNAPYYIHLRTSRTVLPWQFYQAPFDVTDTWQDIRIPFSAFTAQGGLLRNGFQNRALRSLAVAAYGRDHTADLSVRRVGFY